MADRQTHRQRISLMFRDPIGSNKTNIRYKYTMCLFHIFRTKHCKTLFDIFLEEEEKYWHLLHISIGWTLRSWVHEIFSQYRTVSPRLGDNYASKCSSDNFLHTKYVTPCVENCQNYIAMHCRSPISGRRSWNGEKTVGQICPIVFLAFQTFSPGLENNKTSKCDSKSFPRMVTYILFVENCQS